MTENSTILSISFDLIVVSDVHIRDPQDSQAKKLIALLDAAIATPPKAFVLNGDIFDFFFGWSSFFRHKYAEIFLRLERLAEKGTIVWYVEGNHEFCMEKMPRSRVQYMDGFGGVLRFDQGIGVLVAHGDLMRYDPWYFTFRRIIRSHLLSSIAIALPQRLLDTLTAWFAKTSRKKDKYRSLNHDSILQSARQFLTSSNAQHLIFGHFHYPYDEKSSNGGNILSVESWLRPNALALKNGKFERIFL